jgi:uncharacterized protein
LRFWDSSAIVPTVIREPTTERMRALDADDPAIAAWWGTHVECMSAIARLVREGVLDAAGLNGAYQSLESVFSHVREIPPDEDIRTVAERLLNVHPLRAADALQLAAALAWAGERPLGFGFVSLDTRLREAALREGFSLFPVDLPSLQRGA